jgi:hypothetical protein
MKTETEYVREIMNAWNQIEATLRREHPGTDSEELYRMTDAWMKRTLGIAGPWRTGDHVQDRNHTS